MSRTEYDKELRKHRKANGCCPKHGKPVTKLKHCHGCSQQDLNQLLQGNSFDDLLSPPNVGDKLATCLYCDHCGRYYHEGSCYYMRGEKPRKLHGIKEGSQGSLLNYDKRNPNDYNKVWSLCGWCRKEGHDKWSYRSPRLWSGLCTIHARHARLETEDVLHESGAIVHSGARHSEAGVRKRMIKVEFTCANRNQGEHRGITYLSQTKTSNWRGLCAEHLRLFTDPKKLTKDQVIDGAQLLFSQEDEQGRVPIVYDVCKHKRLAPRQTALSYRHTGKIKGLCADCVQDPASLANLLLARASHNAEDGRGKKNDNEKTANKLARKTKRLLEIVDAIIAVWRDVRNPKLSYAEQFDLVMQWRVARKLNVGDPKDTISAANQLGDRLRRLEIRNMIHGTTEPYRDLVRIVIAEAERETPSADIVSELLRPLNLKSAA